MAHSKADEINFFAGLDDSKLAICFTGSIYETGTVAVRFLLSILNWFNYLVINVEILA
jgi:hypothetical protein